MVMMSEGVRMHKAAHSLHKLSHMTKPSLLSFRVGRRRCDIREARSHVGYTEDPINLRGTTTTTTNDGSKSFYYF